MSNQNPQEFFGPEKEPIVEQALPPRPMTALSGTNLRRNSKKITKCINQYVFIQAIGEGMYGKVKLARNSETGEKVVSHCSINRSLI